MSWLPILLVIACLWLLGMTIFRMVARQDAGEAHRNLARLLAEQADDRAADRAIADTWTSDARED